MLGTRMPRLQRLHVRLGPSLSPSSRDQRAEDVDKALRLTPNLLEVHSQEMRCPPAPKELDLHTPTMLPLEVRNPGAPAICCFRPSH